MILVLAIFADTYLYKKHGQSEFKEDTGKIEEFTRQASMDAGAVSNPGEIAIPARAFRHTNRDRMQAFQTGFDCESGATSGKTFRRRFFKCSKFGCHFMPSQCSLKLVERLRNCLKGQVLIRSSS